MRNILRYLAVLLAGVLVFSAARYLDNTPRYHAEEPEQQPSVLQTEQAAPETQPPETQPEETEPVETEPSEQHLQFTFAGNCTLGCQVEHAYAEYGFLKTVQEDYAYPFQNVQTWFEGDDFTLVNLEGVLGDQGYPAANRLAFRGYGSYVNILTQNSVEAVSLANNHTQDFGERGYAETKRILEEAGLPFVEQNSSTVVTLESGVTVGIYGTVYNSIDQEAMIDGIKALKEQGVDLIIYAPHWGVENAQQPANDQIELGHAAIDAGAHIVYGCHPNLLQPIEEYNGGVIFYSLGNFSFGGNMYPADYDTAVIRQEIILAEDGTVTLGERTVVPCSMSSQEERNNFQPTPYEAGSEGYNRVLSKLDGSVQAVS